MKFTSVFAITLAFAVSVQAAPMQFTKRRFGQEHTPEADATFQEVKDLAAGSDKEAQAGNLSGAMVRALLAKAPACDQQDRADEVIDLGREFGGDIEQQYIKVAQTYRQLERNTPGDGVPSELCDKAPRNKELEGLVQAQDPKAPKNPKGDDDPEEENPKGDDDPEEENPKGDDDPEEENPKGGDDPEEENPKGGDDPEEENPKENPKGGDDPEEENPKENPKGGDDPEEENPKGDDDPEEENGDEENVAETDPVGGVKMPKIEQVDGDFIVNGNGFNGNLDAAHSRQCDVQKNLCFNKFNSGDRTFSGQDCEDQNANCKAGPPVFA